MNPRPQPPIGSAATVCPVCGSERVAADEGRLACANPDCEAFAVAVDSSRNHRSAACVCGNQHVIDVYREALREIAKRGPVFDAKGTWSKQVCEIARAALRQGEAERVG